MIIYITYFFSTHLSSLTPILLIVLGLFNSLNPERRKTGARIYDEACSYLTKKNRISDRDMLQQALLLFTELNDLAVKKVNDKDRIIKHLICKNLDLSSILVPSQSTLLHAPLATYDSSTIQQNSNNHTSHLTYTTTNNDNNIYIHSFDEEIEIKSSKARPKVISLLASNGNKVKFLLKQEKDGDLRKDSRMMEVNAAVNRIFGKSYVGYSI